jgi:drug/metabolite transporter (DMT)-like permease
LGDTQIVPAIGTQRVAALAVAMCGTLWGGFWYPLRWLDSTGVGSAWVSVIFFAIAVLIPLPWMTGHKLERAALFSQLLTGLLLGTAFSLYTISLVLTDVVHAILLFYLTPVWSTLGSIILLGERLTRPRAIAMALGFGGMISMFGVGGGLPVPHNGGDWIALASGMFWAAGSLRAYSRPSTSIALPVFSFSAGGLISAAIILAIAMAMGAQLASTHNLMSSLPAITLFAFIVFIPPNYLVLWAAQRVEPARVGILLMTEVLAGSITAALFSGDAFGFGEAAGTVMILCAGAIEVLGRR